MIKGSTVRRSDYPVDAIFVDRWSPYAMSAEEIPEVELMALLEASRWAPSAFNAQPWRMLYARRGHPVWPLFLDLLVDLNKVWAHNAAALVLFVSKKVSDRTGEPSVTHSFDTGAAWGFFALQGFMKGYVVHGMQGFDYARAQRELGIPELFRVEAMVAVGRPAPTQTLPQSLQEYEVPSDRRPLNETICEGRWSLVR